MAESGRSTDFYVCPNRGQTIRGPDNCVYFRQSRCEPRSTDAPGRGGRAWTERSVRFMGTRTRHRLSRRDGAQRGDDDRSRCSYTSSAERCRRSGSGSISRARAATRRDVHRRWPPSAAAPRTKRSSSTSSSTAGQRVSKSGRVDPNDDRRYSASSFSIAGRSRSRTLPARAHATCPDGRTKMWIGTGAAASRPTDV